MPDRIDSQTAITQTKLWIDRVIIKCGFCPFAKPVYQNEQIHYHVVSSKAPQDCLGTTIEECLHLDKNPQFETSFIIFTQAYFEFFDYMQGLALAEALLEKQGYRGIYQIASFHPSYCFAEQSLQDPANYTNRSPLPMFHLIRESSIDKALQTFVDPESIPQRNITRARELGIDKMRSMLKDCQGK